MIRADPMAQKQVLIISNPEDGHVNRVVAAIRELDAKPIMLFPEDFGNCAYLSMVQEPGYAPETHITLETAESIQLKEIDSIWYRRPRLVRLDAEEMSAEGMEFARDEWRAALEALYALVQEPLWVSHPDNLKMAARKPEQLRLATILGLSIPRTLISNDPHAIRRFYDSCDGQVIFKATGSGWVYEQDGDDLFFVLTNRVSRKDTQADEKIVVAPATYQQEIPKLYEIRAHVVGQQVLAVRIDSQQSEVSELDWRRYDVGNTPYSPYKLPAEIEVKCLQFTQCLGLEFGAIDLVRQPDGQYIFLEINAAGQFLWAEELSGVPVSYALASLLVGAEPPLKNARFR